MVLACHASGVFNIGEQGVDGFLLMSGWLNALSLHKSIGMGSKIKAVSSFFIHRAFRILPVFYLLLFMIFLFLGINSIEKCGSDILEMIFMTANSSCWAVYWSL